MKTTITASTAANAVMPEFMRAQVEDFTEDHEIALDDLRVVANLQRLCGIDDVVRRHAVMEPSRCLGVPAGGHRFGDGCRESDHVVPRLGLNGKDARHVE